MNQHEPRKQPPNHPDMVRGVEDLVKGQRYTYSFCVPGISSSTKKRRHDESQPRSINRRTFTFEGCSEKDKLNLRDASSGSPLQLSFYIVGFVPDSSGAWECCGHLVPAS